MANKTTTVACREILTVNRFEPKFFLFQSIIKKVHKKFQFINLGKIATDIKRGQSPKPETYKDKWTGKYLFIRTADVKKYKINTESAVYLDHETTKNLKSNQVKNGDLLISVVGNYLGSTSVIPCDIKLAFFNDNSAKIHVTNDKFSPYLISYFLNSKIGQQMIQSLTTRTGQKIISAGNLKKISIPIINDTLLQKKAEQTSINETTANALITQAQKLFYSHIGIDFKAIKKTNTYSVHKSDFNEADLWTPMYSYPLYVNTLKAIKEKWETITIGEIASIKKGDEVGSDEYIGYLDKRETDVPFVRTSDIVNYETDQYPDYFIPVEIYEELNQDLKTGDVLFTNDGKIGMVGMITENDKLILQSHIKRIRTNDIAKKHNITPEYLFIALSIKEVGLYQAKQYTVIQSTIPTISNNLKKIEIPILDKPSIDEITALVKQAFQLKAEKKRLISSVRAAIDALFEI